MANELRFNLDTSTINYVGKRCKQNDDRTLVLTILDKGVAFPVTGATLSLKAQRPNNTYVIQDTNLNITNNIVTINMVRDITRVAGKVKLELKITLASKDISTFTFFIEVEPSVITEGSLASQNVITSLEELQSKINAGNLLESELDRLIESGNATAYQVENVTNEANITRTALLGTDSNANATLSALEISIGDANDTIGALTQDTNEATIVKNLLGNMVTDATNVSITLNETITNSIGANTTLGVSIDNGEYIRNDIVQVSENANWLRDELFDLINEAKAINLTPIGSIVAFTSATIPSGWKLADGQAISRTTYASLFSTIGTTYGVGDGSTTFNLPNLKGRIPVGLNPSETEFDSLGETGGEKVNMLVENNLPAHTHEATATADLACTAQGDFTIKATSTLGNTSIPDENSYLAQVNKVGATFINPYNNTTVIKDVQMPGGIVTVNGTVSGDVTVTNESVGSGTPVNNIQPYLTLNYIIRAI